MTWRIRLIELKFTLHGYESEFTSVRQSCDIFFLTLLWRHMTVVNIGLWCALIFIQRVVWFLSPSLGESWIKIISHHKPWGILFITYFPPICVFVYFILWRAYWRRNTQCDIEKLSYEWYHIDTKENLW
jgi:hypothetical protein